MTAICQAGSRNEGKTKTDVDILQTGVQRGKMDEKDQQMNDGNVCVDA